MPTGKKKLDKCCICDKRKDYILVIVGKKSICVDCLETLSVIKKIWSAKCDSEVLN